MPKKKREDFIDLYHASWSIHRPDTHTQRGSKRSDLFDTEELRGNARRGTDEFTHNGDLDRHQAQWAKHVLYTGPADTVARFMGDHREFVHHYRVPRSAIEDLGYGDDMAAVHELPHRELFDRGHAKTLFSGLPLSNRHVVSSGRVQTYLNHIEAPRDNPVNYVIPLTHMKDLGIKYVGTYHVDDINTAARHFLGERGSIPGKRGSRYYPAEAPYLTHRSLGISEESMYNLGLSVIQAAGRRRAFGRPVARKPDSSGEVSVGGKTSALTSPQFTQLSLFGENE